MIYRGAIHLHTNYCDGDFGLSEIRQQFLAKGYSFVCITTHAEIIEPDQIKSLKAECSQLSSGDFVMIPGVETKTAGGVDILAIGVPARIKILAHPKTITRELASDVLSNLNGVEVWNANYDGNEMSRVGMKILRNAKKNNFPVMAFAGLDFHSELCNPFFTEVNLPELTEEAILSALLNGEFRTVSPKLVINSDGMITKKSWLKR